MPIQLNRIIIFSGKVNLLKQFYQHHFAFTLAEEIPEEWVVLNAGNIQLAFHRVGESYRSNTPFIGESNTKLAFKIDSDINTFRSKMLAEGVAMRDTWSYPGSPYNFCDGEDPEGNVFQLMCAL